MTTFNTSEEPQMQRGRMCLISSRDLKTSQENLIVLCLRLARLEGYIRTLRQEKKSGLPLATLKRVVRLRKRVQQCCSSASFQKNRIVPSDVYILIWPRIATDLLQWSV